MTFIDWSDGEGMFGLLLDFVADERRECQKDPERRRFLSDLLTRLRAVAVTLPEVPTSVSTQGLMDLRESADSEFAGDPAMIHLEDCIEELERVAGDRDESL